jgi:hypothetical protein
MADQVRRTGYYTLAVADRPSEAARVLRALAGVNLLVFSGFPRDGGSQLDFVPEDAGAFETAAQRAQLPISARKECLHIQGGDRAGAMSELLGRLGDAGINVRAVQAVCAGQGRFGAILWVAPADLQQAAQTLGAA